MPTQNNCTKAYFALQAFEFTNSRYRKECEIRCSLVSVEWNATSYQCTQRFPEGTSAHFLAGSLDIRVRLCMHLAKNTCPGIQP